jgi:hypothetical protein
MIRRLPIDSDAGTSFETARVAIDRGMADVLTALDNAIDDDAALGRVYAGLARKSTAAQPAASAARWRRPAPSRRRQALRCVAAIAAAALAAGTVALRAIGVPEPEWSHGDQTISVSQASYLPVRDIAAPIRMGLRQVQLAEAVTPVSHYAAA